MSDENAINFANGQTMVNKFAISLTIFVDVRYYNFVLKVLHGINNFMKT